MSSISNIQTNVQFIEIVNFSFLLLSVFTILSVPGLIVVWLLRKKSIWLRATVGVLSVVLMSVVIPVMLLLFPGESSGAVNYLPVN